MMSACKTPQQMQVTSDTFNIIVDNEAVSNLFESYACYVLGVNNFGDLSKYLHMM